MDLGTLFRILGRWWAEVGVLLAATVVTAFGVGGSIEPDYEAEAAVLLLAPASTDSSPFASAGRTLETTATAMALVMNGQEIRREVAEQDADTTYTVSAGTDTPILEIRVVDADPADAIESQELLLDTLDEQLADRQLDAGATDDQLIRSARLTRSTDASERHGARDRAVAGVLALGVVATVAGALLAETFRVRRRARAANRAPRRAGDEEKISSRRDPDVENVDTVPSSAVLGASADTAEPRSVVADDQLTRI